MRTLLLSLTVTLTTVALLAGCSARSADDRSNETASDNPALQNVTVSSRTMNELNIRTLNVETKPVQGSLVVPARVVPDQDREAVVGTLVQGRVHRVLVNAGDHVRKGEELMLIEGLEIGEIKAQFIKAKAHLRYAEAGVKRQRLLHEQNVGSEKTLIEAESEYQKALAEFTAEDRKIHSIGLSDADVEQFVDFARDSASSHVGGVLPIRAPLSGIVAERNVVQGQLVDPATNAFRIVNTDLLWVDGQLHERDLDGTIAGGTVTLTVTALPGREFRGNIIFVSPIIDQQSRTVTVRAAVMNPGGVLKPNMFGELRVQMGQKRNALVIPREAVVKDHDSTYVFVGMSDTTFTRREVVLGSVFRDGVEVRSGLQPGERVVASGSFLLKSELMKSSFGEEE